MVSPPWEQAFCANSAVAMRERKCIVILVLGVDEEVVETQKQKEEPLGRFGLFMLQYRPLISYLLHGVARYIDVAVTISATTKIITAECDDLEAYLAVAAEETIVSGQNRNNLLFSTFRQLP